MKKLLFTLTISACLFSFTVADSISVLVEDLGVTIQKTGDYGSGEQNHELFVPGKGEDLQAIMKKAVDWQALNKTHRKSFQKEINRLDIWHSAGHFKMIESTEYNHQASFIFEGSSDGSCKLIIKETKGRTKNFVNFYVVEDGELAAFADKFQFNKNCAAADLFE